MESVDLEVLRNLVAWLNAGKRATLATVVRTWGSSPRPVGAWLAVREDGVVAGSVSGGCIEDDLIERARAGTIARDLPEVVAYGVSRDEAQRFGLPCGGRIELVVEPLRDAQAMRSLLACVERRELSARRLDLASGRVSISPAGNGEVLTFDGKFLVTIHGPRWRLLIIGAGQLSRYLAHMAQALDYQVLICDPREEYALGWDVPGAELTREMPDDAVARLNLDSHSAVVALTHDPKLDDLALLEALKSAAFYVGALGSRQNNDNRRARLAGFDLTAEELARLRGPVGLPIGSRTPPEIAVSILAEMTAVKRGAAQERLTAAAAPGQTASDKSLA